MKKPKSIKVLTLIALNILLFSNFAYPGNILKKEKEVPLSFIENKGQIKDASGKPAREVLFTSLINTTGMFFQKNKVSYIQYNSCIKGNPALPQAQRVDVEFLNANPNSQVIAGNATGSVFNFYGPSTKGDEARGLKGYKQLSYINIYKNIDVIYTIMEDQVKYDIVVRPGGNINEIRMNITGADAITTTDKKTTITTALGEITDEVPLSYYDETKSEVTVKLQQEGNILSFSTGELDKTKTLVIDPVLAFFNLFGPASNGSGGLGESVGNSNNISWALGTVIVGYSNSTIFSSTGRYGTGSAGRLAFISFFDFAGVHQWSSTVECSGTAVFNDVQIFGSTLIACGQTQTGLPLAQNVYGGGDYDGFAALFQTNGVLNRTFYIGGPLEDAATCITNGLHTDDKYVIGGYSKSEHLNTIAYGSSNPVTSFENLPSHYALANINRDGFLFSFRITGGTFFLPVKYTFTGSNYEDLVTDLDFKYNYSVPSGAKLYVTGATKSDRLSFIPASTSIITPNNVTGDWDVFVQSWDLPAGSTPSYSFTNNYCTFLGSDAGNETVPRIDVTFESPGAPCPNSDVYVSFVTTSSALSSIRTPNAYQGILSSPKDNFFTTLNYQLNSVIYASYFNNATPNPLTGNDLPLSIKADWLGNKYLCSTTNKPAFPHTDRITVSGNVPGTPVGNLTDIFLSRLNPDYSLGFQALTGTNFVDFANEIDVQQMYYGVPAFCDNPIYITGATFANPSSSNPVFAINSRVNDNYVLSLASSGSTAPSILTLLNGCYLANTGVSFTIQWYYNGAPIGTPQSDYHSFAANEQGEYYATVTMRNCVMRSKSIFLTGIATKPTGIKEQGFVSSNEIKVYPNPAMQSFYILIDNAGNADQIRVTDLMGRSVYTQAVEGKNSLEINCSDWKTGLYLVKIYSAGKILRIIKLSKSE